MKLVVLVVFIVLNTGDAKLRVSEMPSMERCNELAQALADLPEDALEGARVGGVGCAVVERLPTA